MLERASADHRAATAEAVAPVVAWCEDGGDLRALRKALRRSLDAYIAFELSPAGTRRRGALGRLAELFHEGPRRRRSAGCSSFDVDDAVVLWASLTSPPPGMRDLSDGKVRKRHVQIRRRPADVPARGPDPLAPTGGGRRPEARATGRATAARIASSVPARISRSRARVTAV